MNQAKRGGPVRDLARAPTAAESRLIETAMTIHGELPSGDEMAYLHAVLCQVGLPRRRVFGPTILASLREGLVERARRRPRRGQGAC